MAKPEQEGIAEHLTEADAFRRNAFLLIKTMVALAAHAVSKDRLAVREDRRARDDVTALVNLLDEILHSIFFLGGINSPPFSPDDILRDVRNDLQRLFRRPFRFFTTHVPRRSPFSCVLDMIVHLNGGNEAQIIDGLRALIRNMKLGQSRHLVSSTICVSQNDKDPVKYYGVSMSASGSNPRKIMIAASCLGSWDRYVAGAVMTYFPTKKKKTDFDGTIRLPEGVRCQAFSLLDNKDKPSCRSCGNLFGLTPCGNDEWVYGNCAEVESLSNLFKNVDGVKERARPTSVKYSDEKRVKIESVVKTCLTESLKQRKFTWDKTFYTPQFV